MRKILHDYQIKGEIPDVVLPFMNVCKEERDSNQFVNLHDLELQGLTKSWMFFG